MAKIVLNTFFLRTCINIIELTSSNWLATGLITIVNIINQGPACRERGMKLRTSNYKEHSKFN